MEILRANLEGTAWTGAASDLSRSLGCRCIALAFAATLGLSSLLLFLVQPMVAKMLLPAFGGAPAVWNTCMVFFQAVLLAGYGYAHFSSRLTPRSQMLVHAALLLLPLFIVPLGMASVAGASNGHPSTVLLTSLVITVGVPFFVVSTHAPLLQKWFGRSDHPAASDPYFLYAASNIGSLAALLGYPILVEPLFDLAQQLRGWNVGYALLVGMVLLCARLSWPRDGSFVSRSVHPPAVEQFTTRPRKLDLARWTLLALVPSSLMLGVTAHITNNLAAVPLLWVIPLAIYLLSFVFVFARRPPITHERMSHWLPFLVLPLAVFMFVELGRLAWLTIPLHLLVLFAAAMVCHGELARRRPPARHLTGYYLCMSIGGVLGGSFNALVAPLIFDSLAEYPLMVIVACLLRSGGTGILPVKSWAGSPGHGDGAPGVAWVREADPWRMRHGLRKDIIYPCMLAALSAGMLFAGRAWTDHDAAKWLIFAVPAVICFTFKERPLRFGLGYAVVLAALAGFRTQESGRVLDQERNFFGVKRVEIDRTGKFHLLVHGSTNHGSQSTDPALRSEPSTYYTRSGPLGDVFAAFNAAAASNEVAVIGLGTGSMAAYVEPGQRFTFYEIDPAIERIARDPGLFTYLADCRGDYGIILGDGRLRLAESEDARFGMIVLDAFSSDAIPTHLVSREALELYLSKLAPNGLLVVHISNRYLNLEPVLGNLAAEAGLLCLSRTGMASPQEAEREGKLPAHYVVMVRSLSDLSPPMTTGGRGALSMTWKSVTPHTDLPVWTDQYSNLLSLLRRK